MRTLAALLIMLFSVNALAQSVMKENEVSDFVQSIESSLNSRDWEAFGSKFSQEGDFILFDSRRATGPDDIQALIDEAWTDTPADVTAKLTPASIRLITPQIAIVTVNGEFAGSQPGKDRAIFVLFDHGNGWQLEALRVFNAETM